MALQSLVKECHTLIPLRAVLLILIFITLHNRSMGTHPFRAPSSHPLSFIFLRDGRISNESIETFQRSLTVPVCSLGIHQQGCDHAVQYSAVSPLHFILYGLYACKSRRHGCLLPPYSEVSREITSDGLRTARVPIPHAFHGCYKKAESSLSVGEFSYALHISLTYLHFTHICYCSTHHHVLHHRPCLLA